MANNVYKMSIFLNIKFVNIYYTLNKKTVKYYFKTKLIKSEMRIHLILILSYHFFVIKARNNSTTQVD